MNTESLREYCLSLPAVTEDVKWGHDLCFSIGGKMFCVTGLSGMEGGTSFKVTDEEFEEMSSRPGIIPAPYMARNKWVSVREPERLSRTEWEQYIRQSYNLISSKLTKKLRKELGLEA